MAPNLIIHCLIIRINFPQRGPIHLQDNFNVSSEVLFFFPKKFKVIPKYNGKNTVGAILYENKIIVFQKLEIILAILRKTMLSESRQHMHLQN